MPEPWSLYPYEPNKPAPIIFALLLLCLAIHQFHQSFILHNFQTFGTVMTWASLIWISGFICRSISVHHVTNLNLFIAQYVLILMGPPLYAAAEYFILGRLLAYLPYHAPLHPGRVYSTFILLSTGVELLTANGAANAVGSDRSETQYRIGRALLRAALILQGFVEALFMALVAMVEWRCRRKGNKNFPKQVRIVCYVLYITSSMILVRCIVRTIEGFEAGSCGHDDEEGAYYCGIVARNEWFLWVFEIANITLFVVLFAVFPPGRYLPSSSKVFLDPNDGRTERMGPGFGKADKRPLFVTVVDPFNFYGIVTGRGMVVDKFWEREQPVYCRGDAGNHTGRVDEAEGLERVEPKSETGMAV